MLECYLSDSYLNVIQQISILPDFNRLRNETGAFVAVADFGTDVAIDFDALMSARRDGERLTGFTSV